MEYLDALRGDGWLADPTDRVAVVAVHEPHCPAAVDVRHPCACAPRLQLRHSAWWGGGDARHPVVEFELPSDEARVG